MRSEGNFQGRTGIRFLAALVAVSVAVVLVAPRPYVNSIGVASPLGNLSPVAVCSGPATANVSAAVRFDGSASYDPDRTGRWSSVSPLPEQRRGMAVAAVGGRIYAIGGGGSGPGGGPPLNRTEGFHPAEDTC